MGAVLSRYVCISNGYGVYLKSIIISYENYTHTHKAEIKKKHIKYDVSLHPQENFPRHF